MDPNKNQPTTLIVFCSMDFVVITLMRVGDYGTPYQVHPASMLQDQYLTLLVGDSYVTCAY